MITVKTTTEVKQEPKPFPKLMKSINGNIVLFESPQNGVLIVKGETNKITGNYSCEWDMNNFTDYNEPITIQNAIS